MRITPVDDINQIPVSIQKPEQGKSIQVRNMALGMFLFIFSFLRNFILSQGKSIFRQLYFIPQPCLETNQNFNTFL